MEPQEAFYAFLRLFSFSLCTYITLPVEVLDKGIKILSNTSLVIAILFDAVQLAEAVKGDTTTALFVMLEQLPLGTIVSFIATILIMIFFITSADSATFVLDMLTSDGKLNPSARVKLAWGILQSSIAVVLLISGGLGGLQTASIVAAPPFAIVLIGMCFSLL